MTNEEMYKELYKIAVELKEVRARLKELSHVAIEINQLQSMQNDLIEAQIKIYHVLTNIEPQCSL
jgi:hypothetical protein